MKYRRPGPAATPRGPGPRGPLDRRRVGSCSRPSLPDSGRRGGGVPPGELPRDVPLAASPGLVMSVGWAPGASPSARVKSDVLTGRIRATAYC